MVRNENTELMDYVACLRVALNNLLSETDLGTLDLPGAVGKVKISEKVEQMIKVKEQEKQANVEAQEIKAQRRPGPLSKQRVEQRIMGKK